MGKALNRLSARLISNLRTSGRHADGGNLYAAISKDGKSRRWVFLYRWQGRRCEMGLGGWTPSRWRVLASWQPNAASI
jgi:hypothetical protein